MTATTDEFKQPNSIIVRKGESPNASMEGNARMRRVLQQNASILLFFTNAIQPQPI